ncbi:MAG TPA: metallophosphoesterase, partial [bacterium]|nr:metallophosphoesterase [bacterium]
MCVNGAGTVVWYTDRGGRAVHRMVGTPATGYTEDSGFALNLEDGSAAAGFRAIALSLDETRLFICDNRDQCILVVDSTTGSIQRQFGTSLLGYDLDLDEEGNVYVSSYGTPGRVDKFRYVAPAGEILDNSDPGCTVQGTWSTDATQSYGPNRYTKAAGSGTATVTWTASVTPGWYLVRFWMTSNTTFATNARYSITHRDGISVVVKNQQQTTSNWVHLGGAYYFDGTATVTLNDQFTGGSSVVADAIQLTPVVTMIQMSDSHVGYPTGTANTTAVVNELKTLGRVQLGTFGFEAPPPSFAIHSGDFTEYGQEYWDTLMSIFTGMPLPTYFVQGNHDSTWSSCKERIRSLHGNTPYSFDHYLDGQRLHFACMNSPVLQSPRAGFSREELDWLAADLAALEPNTLIFISIHHPINGASDPKPFDTYHLLETLRPYRLAIIFYGHGHSFVAPTFDRAQLLQGGSTYNNSTDLGSYAVIAITKDRI